MMNENDKLNQQPLPMPIKEIHRLFSNPMPCNHEWGGWRNFPDGNGGEQVCKKCGLGAMAHTLRTEP